MKIVLTICILTLGFSVASGQKHIDSLLQKKIIGMFKEDQKWRIELNNLQNGKKSAFDEASIEQKMGVADSLNMIQARQIIKKHGFPGFNLVGEDGSNAFWAIIQHCDDDVELQQQVLTLMAMQVKKRNASGENFAFLQDRVLTNKGQKQLYGTQVHVDPSTHRANPLPIQDSLKVDSRRKAVGLSPLKDYLKLFEK